MKHLLPILLLCSITLTQELTVEGDLTVTGNIQNQTIDSLSQQISSLLSLISELEFRIENMECLNNGIIPEGYCDCNGNVLDTCGVCGGDAVSETTSYECICGGLTVVELWGQSYDIDSTTVLGLSNHELIGSIPAEIGCLTNLTWLYLYNNQLSGEIPPEIGNLTNLTDFKLDNNQLIGEIPSEIGNLTNLERLHLNHNQLSGGFPPEVCGLIESNNLNINDILNGNPDLINTCE